MTLDKEDEVKIQKIVTKTVVNALEQVVLPKFDDVSKKFKKIDKNFKKVDERLEIIEDTTTRIELNLESVVKRQDEQGDNIIKINKYF